MNPYQLPTCAKLNSLFPINDMLCKFFGCATKTTDHLFLNCSFTAHLWFISKSNFFVVPFTNEPLVNLFELVLNKMIIFFKLI